MVMDDLQKTIESYHCEAQPPKLPHEKPSTTALSWLNRSRRIIFGTIEPVGSMSEPAAIT